MISVGLLYIWYLSAHVLLVHQHEVIWLSMKSLGHTGGPCGTFAQVEAGLAATILVKRLEVVCREAIRRDEIIIQ